ncbi:hypothetical protein SAMN02745116_01984 [Pilibacter termitis]|uniref:Uncharacterized protein n=1 Tax=Pilibacter termitis TaxID=263852 RepID=A0A1T4PXQ5_9ENTE|nr:hypothetical protein [Pilibacter termitis]SJZ96314.1 hypothetical protein SAMN02745116_01984 [Pilibacter termitis]
MKSTAKCIFLLHSFLIVLLLFCAIVLLNGVLYGSGEGMFRLLALLFILMILIFSLLQFLVKNVFYYGTNEQENYRTNNE